MWSVYGIVSPITDIVIYVGCTSRAVSARVSQHASDTTSSAYNAIQFLRSQGLREKFVILATYRDHKEALLFEQKMILALPGLCNREYRKITDRQLVASLLDQEEVDALLNGERVVIRRVYTDYDDVPEEKVGTVMPDSEYERLYPELAIKPLGQLCRTG